MLVSWVVGVSEYGVVLALIAGPTRSPLANQLEGSNVRVMGATAKDNEEYENKEYIKRTKTSLVRVLFPCVLRQWGKGGQRQGGGEWLLEKSLDFVRL